MLRRVALVRTDVSEELSASFIRVTRICEIRTTLAVTSNRRTLRRNTYTNVKKSGSYPRNRPWRPIGLRDVEDPTLSRQSAHRWQ
jgi:hypothetical protein